MFMWKGDSEDDETEMGVVDKTCFEIGAVGVHGPATL